MRTYITRQQTTELLHISATTLWRYEKSGKIQKLSIGGKILYDAEEIEKVLKQTSRKTA